MDSMNLIGADDVYKAGYMMQSAAQDMKQAASGIEYAFMRHQSFLEEFLQRFEMILNTEKGE